MRKFLLIILTALFALPAMAEEELRQDGVIYTLYTPDGAVPYAEITGNYIEELTGLVLPSTVTKDGVDYTVTSIGKEAFLKCHLTSVSIPNSVLTIGDDAFCECHLTSVSIPNSVLTIGIGAFSCCFNLTSVIIPSSVQEIGDGAFYWSYLSSICVEENNVNYCSVDGVLFDKGIKVLIAYPIGKLDSQYLIPSSVLTIEADAFFWCNFLTSVSIPNSMQTIGDKAFHSCHCLKSVSIPNSVQTIGNNAFEDCFDLTSVSIPNSVQTIGNNAFRCCNGLTSVTIPNSVQTIGNDAFGGCNGLTSVTIPNSVKTIGNYAFSGCNGLTSVTIPNSVKTIGDLAFSDCNGLTSVTIPNSVKTIGYRAFDYSGAITEVNYYTTEPITTEKNIFSDVVYANATLNVAEGGAVNAKMTEPWKYFVDIQEKDFSGVEEVIAEFDAGSPIEVFDLKGVKIADSISNLPSGLYIFRQGNISKKVVVK